MTRERLMLAAMLLVLIVFWGSVIAWLSGAFG
jgi:hypothetical protein